MGHEQTSGNTLLPYLLSQFMDDFVLQVLGNRKMNGFRLQEE